jgi:hypothetical protein
MRLSSPAILLTTILSAYSINIYAAPCESNFASSGNFITGTSYKTYAELSNTSVAKAFDGVLADIAKTPSWKILAQDKANGMIQAVQADSYNKSGKVIPLNINIVPASNGAKINMDYVTPAGSLSPASAVKSQFCQTIAAAEIGAGSSIQDVANNNSANPQTSTGQPQAANNSPQQLPGISMITPAQQAKISKELGKKIVQKDLQVKITEASKTIQPFLERRACITEWKASSSLNIYAAPGANFANNGAPMVFGFQYHDKAQCLTVAKVQGWKSPALNALQFEVLYLAEDSAETKKENHELVKQTDGEWLFTR